MTPLNSPSHALSYLHAKLEANIEEHARDAGISLAQYRILSQLQEEPLRPADLVDRLQSTHSAISHRLASLAGAGLVSSEPDRYDRRAVRISITPEGERVRSGVAGKSATLDQALAEDDRLAGLIEALARAVVVVDDHMHPRFVRKRIR